MKKKIKILFLSMTCDDSFFSKEVDIIKNTWGKDIIDGKYGENVNLLFYDGWNEQHHLDTENHILHVRCEDDLYHTFKKTYYALSLIQNKFDYDFIFRTNTSTYINVPLVLKLIDYLNDNEIYDQLWVSELVSLVEANVPYPLNIYGRGNGMIFSKHLIDILLKEGISYIYDDENSDDTYIGKTLNSYWIKNNENYIDHLKCYGHSWYKSSKVFKGSNNNQLCEYFNENSDFEFLKKFLTIQLRQYNNDRIDELKNYEVIHKVFDENKDEEIDKTLENIIEYSKNPDIFIGSILGHISYDFYNTHSKQWLWNLQCSNKADDDKYKEKFKNKIWF